MVVVPITLFSSVHRASWLSIEHLGCPSSILVVHRASWLSISPAVSRVISANNPIGCSLSLRLHSSGFMPIQYVAPFLISFLQSAVRVNDDSSPLVVSLSL